MRITCRNGNDVEWALIAIRDRAKVDLPLPPSGLIFPMFDLWLKGLGMAVVLVVPDKKVRNG